MAGEISPPNNININHERSVMLKGTKKPVAETGETEGREFRHNPQRDSQIDEWIGKNPKHWAYIQAMPPDRMARTIVLNEVRKMERVEKMDAGILRQINENPEQKQHYEALVKDLPEDQREKKMISMAREKMRKGPQESADRQSQGTKTGVGV
jgi:hypothetical protein